MNLDILSLRLVYVRTLEIFNGFFAFVISQALKMLKASDVKPYVVFISPPSYDRILTLRRGKVDPFNPQPTAQMSVSVLNPLCNQRSMKPRYTSFIFTCVHCPKCSLRHTFTNFSFQFLMFTFLNIPQWGFGQQLQTSKYCSEVTRVDCRQSRADRRRFLDFQDAELREMVDKAREMEETYGHYFDKTIVNTDLERTFDELRLAIDKLDTEAQWVPAFWVNDGRGAL